MKTQKSCGTNDNNHNAIFVFPRVGVVQQCEVMEFTECKQACVIIVVQVAELLNLLSVMQRTNMLKLLHITLLSGIK